MIKFIKNFWPLIACLPYFLVSIQHASRVPIMDDYEMILGTVNDWVRSDWHDKISVLFAQYNEHRIVFPRLVYVIYYSIFGDINFKNLSLLANFQLLVVAFVGVYFIRRQRVYWHLNAVIWVTIVSDLNTYENGSIASYGMQNWSVIMWVFLAFYFYSKPGKWWIAGCLAQFVAVFCSGNGMIAGPFLILSFPRCRTAASIVFAFSFFVYFLFGYEFVHQPGQEYNVMTMAEYFIREIGAVASFQWAGFVFGFGLIVFIIIKMRDKYVWYNEDSWPILSIMGFALASIAEASVFRSGLPGAQFQTSRYLIYPEILWGLSFLFLPLYRYKMWQKVLLVSIIVVFVELDFQFGKLGFERTELRASTYQYYHPNPKEADRISKESCDLGVYCIEDNR